MSDAEHDRDIEREERAIYAIITAALSPVVLAMFLEGRDIDGGGALSLLLVALAVAGIVAGLRAVSSSRLPRARLLRRDR